MAQERTGRSVQSTERSGAPIDTTPPKANGTAFVASRTSGVAPLAVMFDARPVFSGDKRAFHTLGFEWDFADPQSGTWRWSNRSRNFATGPLAAHVFERPGNYVVRLRVRGSNGPVERSTTIRVADPESVFAGPKTICFSARGDFTGCPRGAQQRISGDFGAVVAAAAAGTRVLLRRGEQWISGQTQVLNQPGPGILGAFGTGDKPRVRSPNSVLTLSDERARLSDWRILDLEFPGTAGKMIGADGYAEQVLIQRVSGSNFHSGIQFADSILDYYKQPMFRNIAIVDCEISDMNFGTGGNGVFVSASGLVLMGNRLVDSRDAEHVLRVNYVNGGVISHNYLADAAENKLALKVVSLPYKPGGKNSANIVISDNIVVGGVNEWSAAVGNGSAGHDERLSMAIIERNYFRSGPGTVAHLNVFADQITVRNNVFDLSGLVQIGVSLARLGKEPPHKDLWVYHNTCYSRVPDEYEACVGVEPEVTRVEVRNNLLFAPKAERHFVVRVKDGAEAIVEGNLDASRSPFAHAQPEDAMQAALDAKSPAVDKGLAFGPDVLDFALQPRLADGKPDIGAFEFSAHTAVPGK